MSEIIRESHRIIVRPNMDIVASMANDFRTELQELIQENPLDILLDFKGVEMVDSVGIGVIIATHNSLSRMGRKFSVVNASEDILGLFATMRLDRHFPIEGVSTT